jgi:cytochrome P450
MTVPVDDDVQLADLWSDPYPIYQRLREHSPVHWVPGANRYLIARQADVISSERNTAFSNNGLGNHADVPDIWARCDRANAEIDVALEESMAVLRETPDHSVICGTVHSRNRHCPIAGSTTDRRRWR